MGECIMKKLLLLLISFGFICSTQANESIDLSCAFYESYSWLLDKSLFFTEDAGSLVVFPSVGKYMYEGLEDYYKTKGNEILFSHKIGDVIGYTYDYSLDRTTGAFEKLVSNIDRSGKLNTHKGKCKVVENLF